MTGSEQTIPATTTSTDTGTRPHVGWRSAMVTAIPAAAAAYWFAQSGFRTDVGLLFVVYCLIALGFYVPFAWGGSLSVAYNAYFGIGAYAVAIWASNTDLNVLLAVPIGMVIAGAVAAALAFTTRGLSGFYLAMVTLLFGRAFEKWLSAARGVTGGGAGIGNIPRPEILGVEIGRIGLVTTGVVLVWALMWLFARMQSGIFGLALRARREIKLAVDGFGVDTTRLDVLTLAFGAMVASVAGVFFAFVNRFILADSFALHLIFIILFIPLIGGRGRPWGIAIGSSVVLMLTMTLTWFAGTTLGNLAFGVGVLLMLLFAPQGIYGLGVTLAGRLRRRGVAGGAA